MTKMILAFLLNALVIFVVLEMTPGAKIKSFGTALGVAVVYAGLTWALKWLLVLLTIPLIVLSFGAFLLVINAFLLWLTDKLIDGMEIKGFGPLAMSTLGITVGSVLVNWILW